MQLEAKEVRVTSCLRWCPFFPFFLAWCYKKEKRHPITLRAVYTCDFVPCDWRLGVCV